MNSSSYLSQVQQAVDFIEARLDERVTAEVVAAEIGFSEFHFHRVFVSMLGESVSSYQRRRRLSRAASQLKKSRLSLAKVAADAGFETQESFTRAFKSLFGCTPGHFRQQGGLFAMEKPKLTAQAIEHLNKGVTMEPKFVNFQGQQVLGLAAGFNPDTIAATPELWEQFVARCRQLSLSTSKSFGVCMGSHPDVSKKTGDSFVYMAAVPLPTAGLVTPDMVPFAIPSGKYAVFTHKGPIADFPHTVKYIWSTWLPENRSLYREAADFEFYDERFDPVTQSGEVDVYIPVVD